MRTGALSPAYTLPEQSYKSLIIAEINNVLEQCVLSSVYIDDYNYVDTWPMFNNYF